MDEEKSDFRTGILPTELQIACICSYPISLIHCHGELFIFFFSIFFFFFFFLFFGVSLQVILFLTLLAAELKKTNNKPKRPSVKTLFGNITSWQFIFFLKHSLYIVVISCSIYRHVLVYYTFCSKVQTPIKFDLLWGWCEMGYWLLRHLYHKASYNPNPHVYLTGIYLLLIFFFF